MINSYVDARVGRGGCASALCRDPNGWVCGELVAELLLRAGSERLPAHHLGSAGFLPLEVKNGMGHVVLGRLGGLKSPFSQ